MLIGNLFGVFFVLRNIFFHNTHYRSMIYDANVMTVHSLQCHDAVADCKVNFLFGVSGLLLIDVLIGFRKFGGSDKIGYFCNRFSVIVTSSIVYGQ